ncbi:MAG: CoA-binding protein [Anaerotignaceae bacterium]
MELSQVMEQKTFLVVGDTENKEKFAYKIKTGLEEKGFTVFDTDKNFSNLENLPENIDILDLCINAGKGLQFMQNNKKNFKCIVIQPGAESEQLKSYLKSNGYTFIESCLLVGMKIYC